MKLLIVDCCISQRGEGSRTRALLRAYVEAFLCAPPGAETETVTPEELLALKPFDPAMMEALRAAGKPLLISEEVAAIGGLGSLLQQYAAERDSKTPVHVLALPDQWIYHGKRRELLRRMDLDAAGLRKAVRELLGR